MKKFWEISTHTKDREEEYNYQDSSDLQHEGWGRENVKCLSRHF